jgi:putative ABC transport system substrate-binding protein
MRRRDLIVMLFGGTAVAASRLARAQQLEWVRRIGVLMGFDSTNPEAQTFQKAFTGRLRELGWIDGRNARFEYRWASGTPERFQAYAAELVGLKPDVILANTTPAVAALRHETTTLPIVFVQVTDPLGQGFVANLAHPASNVTGFSFVDFTVGEKWCRPRQNMN